MENLRSEGPVALVTGGGGHIGRAIARRLGRTSSAVAIIDLDERLGTETVDQIKAAGCRSVFIRADVSNSGQTSAYVEEVEATLGPIAIFANNAGIEGIIAPIHQYSEETFDQLLQVNVKGVFLGLKYVLAKMIPRREGVIINTASTSAIRGRAGLAGYVATKHAVLGLTRVAALDVAGTHIRVNAVLPGPIESRMMQTLDEQVRENGGDLRRSGGAGYGRPEDVANVVGFLASAEAAHVNGAAWVVDAGMTVP